MAAGSARLALPPRLARWWALKPAGERRTMTAVALVVAATLGWLALWQPLQKDLAALRAAIPAERAALAEGRRQDRDGARQQHDGDQQDEEGALHGR